MEGDEFMSARLATANRNPRDESTGRRPTLSRDAEAELARNARAGCVRSLDELARSSLGFVVRVAQEYRDRGVPLEELVAEGNIGLLEAARRFDPDRETKFITYAAWWIRKAVLRALHQQARLVAVPYYRIKKDGWALACAAELSLETTVGSGTGTPLRDILEDRTAPHPESAALAGERQTLLREAIGLLSAHEVGVLVRRFGLDGDRCLTLKEAGAELGISRERVRQIEAAAMQKLHRALRRRHAPPRPTPA